MTMKPSDVSMINRSSGITLSILACLTFTVGCAGDKSIDRLHEITDARNQVDSIIRDTREEIATLRRDLATARIVAAKQEAAAAEYRRDINALQAERAELRNTLDLMQLAMSKSQTEQEQLQQSQSQTQTSVASQQALTPLTRASDNSLQRDMEDLKAHVAKLTVELAQLKHDAADKVRSDPAQANHEKTLRSIDLNRDRATLQENMRRHVVPSAAVIVTSLGGVGQNTQTPDASASHNLIYVQPGDSLWKLAHKHATTIDELKRINGLTTDVLQAGQRLILPSLILTAPSP